MEMTGGATLDAVFARSTEASLPIGLSVGASGVVVGDPCPSNAIFSASNSPPAALEAVPVDATLLALDKPTKLKFRNCEKFKKTDELLITVDAFAEIFDTTGPARAKTEFAPQS
jgi:hypothetical protein